MKTLRLGLAGLGMIVDETYRPLLRELLARPLLLSNRELVDIRLDAVASRTGVKGAAIAAELNPNLKSFIGPTAGLQLALSDVDIVAVATPDHRHFEIARDALANGKHVIIEKPAVLLLSELDELIALADAKQRVCKVVYHKLLDPDHKKLHTHVVDGKLRHINHGYCSLFEPRSIATNQFAEWIIGRNPATYVAIHYIKLIDWTFGPHWKLRRITAEAQQGLVRPSPSPPVTWDSVQLRIVYEHPDGREAAFDIHTNWTMPDNYPGYVEQEVQFFFETGTWQASQRQRGVQITLSDGSAKPTPNHHYNADMLEPWGQRHQRGYGLEAIERILHEIAFVEFGGYAAEKNSRYRTVSALTYNDIRAERNCVAVVQALEAILADAAIGKFGTTVLVNHELGGLVLCRPGIAEPVMCYRNQV
jgi:D-galacturonate reductase